MTALILSVIIILLIYISPLIIHRFKTKKVYLRYISKDGSKLSTTLFLKKDDPLWEAVKLHREDIDVK